MQTAHGRLGILAEAAGSLFRSLALDDILPAVGELAERLLPADAYSLWRLNPGTTTWTCVWQRNLPASFVDTLEGPRDDGSLLRDPLFVTDTAAVEMLGTRVGAYAREGIRSLVIVPLRMGGRTHGTVVAYYREMKAFSETDHFVATGLSNLGSSALATAVLYEAETRNRALAQLAERRSAYLANAGAVLAGSLDYEDTLAAIARLAVPEIADWCAVDVVADDGSLRRLAVAHVDPTKIALIKQIEERYPRDRESPHGIERVVRERSTVLLPRISEEMIRAAARDARHLDMVLTLGLVSYMSVPLVAGGRALGAITFATAESGREYGDDDLRFAQEVALRAALAMENAIAYREVSRANRLKDEFLATLSHELRTPLNAVLGYTRMLRTGALPPDKHTRALDTIERNASALTQLVEDVLDVSRIEAGQIRLNVQPVSLQQVIEAAIATVSPAAEARGIRLQPILDGGAPPVSGDADRLQQVVWNLLSNAVKFTPKGGRVQVRLERINSHLELIVCDTGIGIAPEFLPHVFERFRQADSRFSREHGGLGLGLSITRHLVEMHGGAIEASSDGPGTGATFRVTLPLRIVHEEAVPLARVHPRAGAADAELRLDSLRGLTILIVDDEPDARTLLTEVLEAAGATVLSADSTAAGLAILDVEQPHAIVSDIGMPGDDGFAFIARVRAHPDPVKRRTPAAALTAYARSADRTRALQSGFQIHLAKPINPSELAAAIVALAATS